MTDGGDVVLNGPAEMSEEYDELGDNGLRRMQLWVDDSKPVPEWFDPYDTAEARTYDDALALLRRFTYHTLYLDHDLGDGQGRTGLDLLRVIQAEGRCPRRVICISWNPVGRANIEAALEKGER